MIPSRFLPCLDSPPARRRGRLLALGFSMVWFYVVHLGAADSPPPAAAVPDAPSVLPAPILEKPLPPAISQEVPEPQPTVKHLWIEGYWRWQDGTHAWIAPHWELPPVPGSNWVAPRWEKRGNGYTLIEGFWETPTGESIVVVPAESGAAESPSALPQAAEMEIIEEPPPPRNREIILARPSSRHTWLSGYWTRRGSRYVWIPGYWAIPPRPHATWVAPRWERRGHGYVFCEGQWQDGGPGGSSYSGRDQNSGFRAGDVVIRDPMLPPRGEHVGPPPSPHHVWSNGFWVLRDGRRIWIPGHWESQRSRNRSD
jgi:hypothetical protein